MSALGQKQTFAAQNSMPALTPKADMCGAIGSVRFVPIADTLYSTVTRMLPILSTKQVITSPGATGPTPSGVPVIITSPGYSR
jgi:hypothetical protein